MMKFRFLLNGIEIEEPIGFDDFKPVIERTDHHGMSVSVSLNKVGFYGNALSIIQNAYHTDIDTELPFIVQMKRPGEDWGNIYTGVVDLATCEFQNGDEGCRINCNVGEIGKKTTFNNRYDTKVSLLRETALDGGNLGNYSMLEKEMNFPTKKILFINHIKSEAENSILSIPRTTAQNGTYLFQIGTNNITGQTQEDSILLNEIDAAYNINKLFTQISNISQANNNVFFKYFKEENSTIEKIKLKILLAFSFKIQYQTYSSGGAWLSAFFNKLDFFICKNGSKIYSKNIYSGNAIYPPYNGYNVSINEEINEISIVDQDSLSYHFEIYIDHRADNPVEPLNLEFITITENEIKITALSASRESISKISLIHESFSRLSEIISGMTVKSDWYGRKDSNVNQISDGFGGGGALKAILNGYELRKAIFPEQEEPKKIELSFKELYEAMTAIDNIGWGFSEESGQLYLRVERWQWFYKNDVIMTVNNPNNVKRTLKSDKLYTRLKTGYSKYLDEKEINAIDTFHTEREYSTGIKAADKLLEKVCKFIADPYAIEITRRQQFKKDTSNWKYDEDIFVVVLKRVYRDEFLQQTTMSIETGINQSTGIISPETMYNARISPERNALRWAEHFFGVNSSKNNLIFMSGTGNIFAKGSVLAGGSQYYLEDSAGGIAVSENQSIPKKTPLLKPEILSFEYPLTFADYAAILANPYGKIVVDGEECFIQKITPSLMKGTASFELIPAANG